ncbi:hypothetical protein DM02DRAFT_610643 [Periconia macrospinosa]|uniref:F-box domain-containing protein n=1 Tax=Periconia macrospinosa TaxID=97972 RepID=A0A2V1E446_9PLEO|nr:hypothetical protein DM02DRAFT_610643 [Periconia macrospinosa]
MSLLDLPAELVVQIVDHLALEKETLCSLAQTCRLLQNECEKHIYATIDLHSTNDLTYIIEAFERRPARIACVETLNIIYKFHNNIQTTLEDRMRFNVCLHRMEALKHWYVESPFDNFQWDCDGGHEWVEDDMEEFRKALERPCLPKTNLRQDIGLSKLETLVIHSHGAAADFWDLGGFHCLFRHPTLRDLHVSCIVLPPDLPELESCIGSTALTKLVFDECVLNPKALDRILRTPKGLKHLTLGENVYNPRPLPPPVSEHLTLLPTAALEALSHVSHSLESLTHYDPLWRRPGRAMYRSQPLKGDGLRDFHRLKFMEIDPCSFLHQFIYAHVQAPPNLETFRIHHGLKKDYDMYNESLIDLFEELPPLEPYTRLESLKTLEFVQGTALDTREANASHINSSDAVEERHAYAYKLFKHGINMKMYVEAVWKTSLLPPYLHNEQKPELICIYDADDVGFRRHIVDDAPTNLMNGVDLLLSNVGWNITAMEQRRRAVSLAQRNADNNNASEEASQPPETDQLNYMDIVRLRHESGRAIAEVWQRMADMDDENGNGSSDDDDDDDDEDMEEGNVVFGFHVPGEFDPEWDDEGPPAHWFDNDVGLEFHEAMLGDEMVEGFLEGEDDEDDEDEDEAYAAALGEVWGPPGEYHELSSYDAALAIAIENGYEPPPGQHEW